MTTPEPTTSATRAADAAIHSFLVSSSVPIIYEHSDSVGIMGSGTLFDMSGRHFLLTATHVLDELTQLSAESFGIPESPTGSDKPVFTFRIADIVRSTNPAHDVGCIEFRTASIVSDLKNGGWNFLRPTSLDLSTSIPPELILAGYPRDHSIISPLDIKGRIMTFRTTPYEGEVDSYEQSFDPSIEIAMRYDDALPDLKGQKLLSLKGASGCALWRIIPAPGDGIWSPATHMRVSALQTSAKSGHYLRAAKAGVIASLFAKLGISIS